MSKHNDHPAVGFNGQPKWDGIVSSYRQARHSLQFKVALQLVLVLLLVVAGTVVLALRSMGTVLYENELHRAREWAAAMAFSVSRDLATDDGQDHDRLRQAADTLVRARTVAYVIFTDPAGRIVAAAEAEPGLLPWTPPVEGLQMQVEILDTPRLVRFPEHKLTCIDIIVPVYEVADRRASGTGRPILGYLRLASDVSPAKARLAQIGNGLLRISVGVLLLVIPCSLLVTRYIVGPLNELARTASALANGAMDARVPVRSHSEIGQLGRAFNTMANRVTQAQMELLQLAAELEVRVEERTHELQDLASKDPLTGLYNRRHFGEVMRRQFAAAERYGSDLTCLMFDLDHFKKINDCYGHAAGDAVLIILAQSIRSQLRTADVPARFGGDEFILLLPQTPAPAATRLASRIIAEFGERVRQKFPDLPATLSVGLASLRTTDMPSAEAVIKEADLALYAAKAQGRNCVVQAKPGGSATQPEEPANPQDSKKEAETPQEGKTGSENQANPVCSRPDEVAFQGPV